MKNFTQKSISLFLLLNSFVFSINAQDDSCVLPPEWEGNTGSNMTVMLLPNFISSLGELTEGAYVVAQGASGMFVGSTNVYGLSQNSLTVWGDDTQTPELDGAVSGEAISLQLVNGNSLYDINGIIPITYSTNGLLPQPNAVTLSLVECESEVVLGCMDATACNYNMEATEDDGTCEYPQDYYSCDGVCLVDTDEDGVCDELEIAGCTDPTAINYSSDATNDDGSCDYSFSECVLPPEWEGNTGSNMTVMLTAPFVSSLPVENGNGYLAAFSESGVLVGSTQVDGVNQTSLTLWGNDQFTDDVDGALSGESTILVQLVTGDKLYDITLPAPINSFEGNGIAFQTAPALSTLNCSSSDTNSILGCTDNTACNYDETATDDDDSCNFAQTYYDCDGVCLADADGDGVCDELEIVGCTDPTACNYAETATEDDGTCEYPQDFYSCDGVCLNDSDGDGVCDELELVGCSDPTALITIWKQQKMMAHVNILKITIVVMVFV